MDWVEKNEIWNYIDDFIGVTPVCLAQKQWEKIRSLVIALGQPSAFPGHLVKPTECFIGLGIEFKLSLNLRRISDHKLERANLLLSEWKFRTAATLTELQQQLSDIFKKDLKWWEYAMENNNGVSILDHRRQTIRITIDGSTKGEFNCRPGIGPYNL
jgi:hypothetical protein